MRAIELSATRYCPAQFMLGQVFPMDLHYEIYEDEGDAEGKHLVLSGHLAGNACGVITCFPKVRYG